MAHGQRIGCRTAGKLALPHHHAGEERAELHGRVEHMRRQHGYAQRKHQHRQREQFIRAVAGNIGEHTGYHLAPQICHADDHGHQFERHPAQRLPDVLLRGIPTEQHRQQHQHDDGEDILHHQPAQRRMPGGCLQQAVLRKHAGEHHSTAHAHTHAEHRAAQPIGLCPAQQIIHHGSQPRPEHHTDTRARQGHLAHRQQILEMEMQAHTEQEKRHTYMRKFLHYMAIHRVSPPRLSGKHACHQIPHKRRKPQLLSHHAQHQRQRQSYDQCNYHVYVFPKTDSLK